MPRSLIAAMLCAPMLVGAQPAVVATAGQTATPRQTPSFKVESELVVLHVTVQDKRGQHVTNLSPESFQLFENNRPQPLSMFLHQDDPVTIGLILDLSGSMVASRNRLLYAASQFAQIGHPDDEVFALLVGDTARTVLPPSAPFTSDPAVLQAAVSRNLRAGGRTALYDAIHEGLSYLSRGTHARRALVILSDGLDNASETRFDEVLLRAQSSNAAIYAIGLLDPVKIAHRPRELRQLANASGGRAYFPNDHTQTFEAMDAVAREIRNSYSIGFVPADVPHDGKYHRLKVLATSPDGRPLEVRTRQGYTAGLPDSSH